MENSNSSASISSNLTFINSIFDENISLSDEDSQDFFEDPGRYDSSDNETMDVTQDFENEKIPGEETDYDRKIFPGSTIDTKQFGFIFLFLVHKMKLSKNHRKILFRAFKYILPEDNNLPQSYEAIVKRHLKDSLKPDILKMCNFCETTLHGGSCNNENCSKPENIPKGLRSTYDTIVFDAELQIVEVLERNWNEIQDYRSKIFLK